MPQRKSFWNDNYVRYIGGLGVVSKEDPYLQLIEVADVRRLYQDVIMTKVSNFKEVPMGCTVALMFKHVLGMELLNVHVVSLSEEVFSGFVKTPPNYIHTMFVGQEIKFEFKHIIGLPELV